MLEITFHVKKNSIHFVLILQFYNIRATEIEEEKLNVGNHILNQVLNKLT